MDEGLNKCKHAARSQLQFALQQQLKTLVFFFVTDFVADQVRTCWRMVNEPKTDAATMKAANVHVCTRFHVLM